MAPLPPDCVIASSLLKPVCFCVAKLPRTCAAACVQMRSPGLPSSAPLGKALVAAPSAVPEGACFSPPGLPRLQVPQLQPHWPPSPGSSLTWRQWYQVLLHQWDAVGGNMLPKGRGGEGKPLSCCQSWVLYGTKWLKCCSRSPVPQSCS